MARRKLTSKLIDKTSITEPLALINGSDTDYVTLKGHIFTDYGNRKMLQKRVFINGHNGYAYCNILFKDGIKQRRVHRLVAEAYLANPNNLPIVMHINNDKSDPNINNLRWGTHSENTKQVFDDGLAHNDKNWNNTQSIAVVCFDANKQFVRQFGSIREAANTCHITMAGIRYQCLRLMHTKPRKGYYFRFLSEVQEHGFCL